MLRHSARLSFAISIHTPLAGSDTVYNYQMEYLSYFNPHSPCGERPIGCDTVEEYKYFNPHSPCGERRGFKHFIPAEEISIHTPLAGSDVSRCFSPPHSSIFQSTLPLRGATSGHRWRTVHGQISIHAPLAGSDMPTMPYATNSEIFQSTLPLRGATSIAVGLSIPSQISIHTPLAGSDSPAARFHPPRLISIHTPLAGSDPTSCSTDLSPRNFNPHSPCGERLP